MHFSHQHAENGARITKIGIVAALHVALGLVLVKSMDMKVISMPKLAETIMMITPEAPKPPPPPPEPPKPTPKVAPPPQATAPPPEVEVAQQQVEPTIQAAVQPDPAPPGPVAAEAPPAEPGTAAMRTAVFADARGCGTPEYPARAARNGESGTVTLALLVGTDGRVAGSRVQKSSGSRELDKAAVSALSLCKFKPATSGGVAEQAWAQIAYVWTLEQ